MLVAGSCRVVWGSCSASRQLCGLVGLRQIHSFSAADLLSLIKDGLCGILWAACACQHGCNGYPGAVQDVEQLLSLLGVVAVYVIPEDAVVRH